MREIGFESIWEFQVVWGLSKADHELVSVACFPQIVVIWERVIIFEFVVVCSKSCSHLSFNWQKHTTGVESPCSISKADERRSVWSRCSACAERWRMECGVMGRWSHGTVESCQWWDGGVMPMMGRWSHARFTQTFHHMVGTQEHSIIVRDLQGGRTLYVSVHQQQIPDPAA